MLPMEHSFDLGLSTVRIIINEDENASGVFLKTQRNNKPFYSLLTNAHVISSEMIDQKKSIIVKYQNQKKQLELKLDKKERIIIDFKQSLDIDLIIIEIIPKDRIDESLFLKPYSNSQSFPHNLIGEQIQIMEYPGEKELSYSEGIIVGLSKIDNSIFYHNCITEPGSSGSPIVLVGENTISGIHRASNGYLRQGIFIKLIIDIIKDYQRNGEGVEYYENGDLKYDGFFENDEYEGNGTFHYKNNLIYIGEFKNGKKNGFGCVVKNDEITLKGKFEDGKLIESYNNNSDCQNLLNIPNQSLDVNNDNNIIYNNNYHKNMTYNNTYNNNNINNVYNNYSSRNYNTIITINKHDDEDDKEDLKNNPDLDNNFLFKKMKKSNEKKNNNSFLNDFYKGFGNIQNYHKKADEGNKTKDDCLIF